MTTAAFTPVTPKLVSGIGPYQIGHEYNEGSIRCWTVQSGAQVFLDEAEFSITPVSSETSGDMYLTAQAASDYDGEYIYLVRDTLAEQDWIGQGGNRETSLEKQMDRITRGMQELQDGIKRTLKIPVGQSEMPPIIGDPDDRADRAFGFDEAGNPVVGPTFDQIEEAENFAIAAAASASSALRRFDVIADVIAATNISVGEYVYVSAGKNGEEEPFKIYPAGTYTADANLVVDLTGISGQAVSTRTVFVDNAEMSSAPTMAVGAAAYSAGVPYQAVASGGDVAGTNNDYIDLTARGAIAAGRQAGRQVGATFLLGGMRYVKATSGTALTDLGVSDVSPSIITRWASPEHYGYSASNTDAANTVILQRLLDANLPIEFRPETYVAGFLTKTNNAPIMGDGATLKLASGVTSDGYLLSIEGADSGLLKGLAFDCDYLNQTETVVRALRLLDCQDWDLDTFVKNTPQHGLQIHNGDTAANYGGHRIKLKADAVGMLRAGYAGYNYSSCWNVWELDINDANIGFALEGGAGHSMSDNIVIGVIRNSSYHTATTTVTAPSCYGFTEECIAGRYGRRNTYELEVSGCETAAASIIGAGVIDCHLVNCIMRNNGRQGLAFSGVTSAKVLGGLYDANGTDGTGTDQQRSGITVDLSGAASTSVEITNVSGHNEGYGLWQSDYGCDVKVTGGNLTGDVKNYKLQEGSVASGLNSQENHFFGRIETAQSAGTYMELIAAHGVKQYDATTHVLLTGLPGLWRFTAQLKATGTGNTGVRITNAGATVVDFIGTDFVRGEHVMELTGAESIRFQRAGTTSITYDPDLSFVKAELIG